MSSKEKDIVTKIQEILDTLRPYLNMDGGDVEFIKYEDKIVYVKLTGACQACLFTDDTLQNGLYESIKAEIPEIEGVVNVTI
ncbi:MAG: NifU family protein [Bacilli bacterium]|nr:NifU family protein [Bacilli bacterium]